MEDEFDFSGAKRDPVVPLSRGKTRIALRLDEDVIEWFKKQVRAAGGGSYQALINAALREQIEQRTKVHSGRPCLAGTGVTVHRIAGWYKLGMTPEEIAENYDHVSLAQVYAALAYYQDHREEIDADLAAEDAEARERSGTL